MITLLKLITTTVSILILVFLYQNGYIALAFINGDPITFSEIARVIKDRGGPKNAIDKLITEKLVELEAKKRKVVVRTEEVEDEYRRMEKKALEDGKTLVQTAKERDQTLEDLKNNLRLRITIYKIMSQDLNVSEKEIDNYIEENTEIYEGKEKDEIRREVRELLLSIKIDNEYETWIKKAKASTEIKFFIKN